MLVPDGAPDLAALPVEHAAAGQRWRVLALVSAAVLLGMSLWFTASAAAPLLQERWSLDAARAGWLTTLVQLGFVAGTATAALLNLADVLPAKRYFAVSAVLGAAANAALLIAPGYGSALVFRFFTGFFLAGVYPPAMKMVATWFRTGRGLAIGTAVGALTVGKATPYLVLSFEGAGIGAVVTTASTGALLAALLVMAGYQDGPYPFQRRPFSWALARDVARHRLARLATYGYLGHMWELFAMWTLVSLFFADYFEAHGLAAAGARASLVGFGVIAAGGIGAVLAGHWADRLGRERIAIWSMAASGTCALTIGWLMAAPPWLVVPLGIVWGFTVVADSAQFSTVVTEVAPPHAVGTALTLQTSLGFLLTAGTIWLAIEIQTRFGWGAAFTTLAIGPCLGILAMARLRSVRPAQRE